MERIKPKLDMEHAARALSMAITQRTIAGGDAEPFLKLHQVLKESFPLLFDKADVRVVAQTALLLQLSGGQAAEPRVFLAHMDVVPVAREENWEFPPFAGAQADGYVYGRGAADMKGHMIALLEAAESLLATGWIPEGDIIFCLSADEETRGGTAAAICSTLKTQGVRPAFVLDEGGPITQGLFSVSAPVAQIHIAEKGLAVYRLTAVGEGGHANKPRMYTALSRLIKGTAWLCGRQLRPRLCPPVKALFMALAPYMRGANRFFYAHPALLTPVLPFMTRHTPMENALLRSTIAYTCASAGQAENMLPLQAEFTLNCRLLPGNTVDEITRFVRRHIHDSRISITLVHGDDPSQASPAEGPAWNAITTAISILYPKAVIIPSLMLGAGDARRYEPLTDKIYRFSPFLMTQEELNRVHGMNERLSLDNLRQGILFFQQMLQA